MNLKDIISFVFPSTFFLLKEFLYIGIALMSVVRGIRDRKYKFTQVLNSMLEDENLSLKAKGFITYCLSKTDNWLFHISYLTAKLKEGERAIYSTIDECEALGYAIRYQPKKPNGDFDSWETIISDSKEEIALIKEELKDNADFQKSFTQRRFADAQLADAQSVPPSNTEANGTIQKKQQQQQAAKPPAAASSKQTQPKIHKCLEGVDIPLPDKLEISKAYDEKTVAHAISYATHPLTKITKGLAPCIKWACQVKPEIHKYEQDVIDENKKFALKTISVINKHPAINIDVLSQQIEITFPTSQKPAEHIPFDDKNFKEQFLQKLKFYKLL